MLRYPCLVLDHDDTTVDSTRAVNYPQFCEAMARFRPQMEISEAQFFRYCFDPGFYGMCEQVLRYTPEEMEAHVAMWKAYHQAHHPQFFPGIPPLQPLAFILFSALPVSSFRPVFLYALNS